MSEPFILAICGPTSAGKSYFTKVLIELTKENGIHCESISTDDFYNDLTHLTMEKRNLVNYDHPDSISSDEFVKAIKLLQEGKPVEIPIYDFAKHNRKEGTRKIDNFELLIVEGIFSFSFPEVEDYYTLKLYVDMDKDIRVIRRIQRDIEKRGRTFDSVVKQWKETVRPTQLEFVERDKIKADIIIRGDRNHDVIAQMIVSYVLQNKL